MVSSFLKLYLGDVADSDIFFFSTLVALQHPSLRHFRNSLMLMVIINHYSPCCPRSCWEMLGAAGCCSAPVGLELG